MKSLFKCLNNFDNDDDDDAESTTGINCNYYQIDELSKNTVRKGKFSLLHLNIASLGAHKDELEDMLSILDLKLDIIGLTETRLTTGSTPIYKTSLEGYKEYHNN